jgi:hypothetical protein
LVGVGKLGAVSFVGVAFGTEGNVAVDSDGDLGSR